VRRAAQTSDEFAPVEVGAPPVASQLGLESLAVMARLVQKLQGSLLLSRQVVWPARLV